MFCIGEHMIVNRGLVMYEIFLIPDINAKISIKSYFDVI